MRFDSYSPELKPVCLQLFDSNMPQYFAVRERDLFSQWLDDFSTDRDRTKGARYYYLLWRHDAYVACGGFYIQPDGFSARMAWGMVRRDLHRTGIGTELLLFRIRRIRQLFPYSSIKLDTSQHTVAFYERMGFVTTSVSRDFYAPGFDKYDMELRGERVSL